MMLSSLRQNVVEGDIDASLEVIADFHDWFRIRLFMVGEMEGVINEKFRIYGTARNTLGLD